MITDNNRDREERVGNYKKIIRMTNVCNAICSGVNSRETFRLCIPRRANSFQIKRYRRNENKHLQKTTARDQPVRVI